MATLQQISFLIFKTIQLPCGPLDIVKVAPPYKIILFMGYFFYFFG